MYNDQDLDAAVAAGKITPEAAAALRSHMSETSRTPAADEENFRLVSSFNDIFVGIASILVLVGAGWIGAGMHFVIGAILVAAAAWGMAEFFTKKRNMALPSVIYNIAFGGAIYVTATYLLLGETASFGENDFSGMIFSAQLKVIGAFIVTLIAIFAFWKRFEIPISVSSMAGCVVGIAVVLIVMLFPNIGQWYLLIMFLMGIGVFSFAMWWDMQDIERKTRKSDVAFWLHLLASPLIVHSTFMLLGINVGGYGGQTILLALMAVLVYLLLGLVAVAIDRRAMLVSALAYVLFAVGYLLNQVGFVGMNAAVAIVLIGGSLLVLSAFWQNLRAVILPFVPEHYRSRLPAIRAN
jgi:hypothetical protein